MVKNIQPRRLSKLEKISVRATNWVGTPASIVIHTLFFIGIFVLYLFGISVDKILLILTTAVSLEAIYLSIFIQMTVNRTTASIADIEEDIEDIQEDVEELSEDVEDIGEDIDKQSLRSAQLTVRDVNEFPKKDKPKEDKGKFRRIIRGISELANKNLL